MKTGNLTKVIPLRRNYFWLLAIIAVAFALRVYALGAQSLWNDEGNSVALAPLSLAAIADAAARDIHPPLYYFLLHFWMPLVGNSEYAIRFLSVIAGVLVVAVTFRFAYVFFDKEVAIIAAFLSAFSAFQVYYSQEARMYIWVTLWSAVSVYAMTVMLKRGASSEGRNVLAESRASPRAPRNSRTQRTLAWLLYIAATIAALYTQYFAAAIVVAENLAFLVWLVFARRDKRANVRHSIAFWVAAQAIIALAIAPWYLSVRDQLASWPAISESLDLPTLLWRVLNVFSAGLALEGTFATILSIVLGVLFLIGLRWTRNTNAHWGIAMLTLWVLMPVGVMFAISLSRPAYNSKFLLLATPAFFILAARGIANLKHLHLSPKGTVQVMRIASWASVLRLPSFVFFALVILVPSVLSLNNYYSDPNYARDDYRTILQFVDSNARAGDGILVDAPGQIDVVRYYWRGSQPLFLLPRTRPADPAATRADVDDMLGKVQRLFAIYYATEQSDPQGIVEARLAEQAFKARDEWHGNVRLAVYGVAPAARGASSPVDAKFGGEITLIGYQLDTRVARAGDVLTLTLHWRADQTPAARYKVFVHLVDANNRIVAQRDGDPVSDTRTTTTWRAGDSIADNYGIMIDAGTPPGEYTIEIGMYRADNGARLPIARSDETIGDHLILGTVQVQ